MRNDKIMKLFTAVHGEISGSCYTEILCDTDGTELAVDVMKDGNLCWRATSEDLLFDYVTRDL